MGPIARNAAQVLRLDRLVANLATRGLPIPGPAPHLWSAFLAEGMVSVPEAELLRRCAMGVRSGCVVEVGSYRGRSAIALASGLTPAVPLYAVEPHATFVGVSGFIFGREDAAAFYRNMLRSGAYRRVRLVALSSEVVTPGWDVPVELLWLDGDHSYEGVRRDFMAWRPHLTRSATVLFDDCHLSDIVRFTDELTEFGWERTEEVGKITAMRRVSLASL